MVDRQLKYIIFLTRNEYLLHFGWGLKNFVLKEHCDPPHNVKRKDLLARQNLLDGYFTDINWAQTHGRHFQPSSAKTLIKKVLGSARVRKIIELEGKNAESKAVEICQTMFAEYNMKILKFFAWGLHKAFQRIYEKVYIKLFFKIFRLSSTKTK